MPQQVPTPAARMPQDATAGHSRPQDAPSPAARKPQPAVGPQNLSPGRSKSSSHRIIEFNELGGRGGSL